MPERVVATASPEETEELAAELAGRLRPGDVAVVRGELGAGKTTFVRGAARALGVRTPVTSPTFAIGHRYRPHPSHGGTTIAHLDLYRLATIGAEEPDLLADYIDPAQIAFVEWPSDEAPELADPALVVTIHHAGGDTRRIEVECPPRPGRYATGSPAAVDAGATGAGDRTAVDATVMGTAASVVER